MTNTVSSLTSQLEGVEDNGQLVSTMLGSL